MKNADMPAMPVLGKVVDASGAFCGEVVQSEGMTKREMIAMHIMAQTCWNTTDMNNPQHYNYAAESAVKMTDALIKELEK